MNKDKMQAVAFIADRFVRGPIRGVVVLFHGLGDKGYRTLPSYEENEWADAGGLVVAPYIPWTWMNRQTRSIVDELIAAVFEHYKLTPGQTPLLLTGDSMGGQCSLLYARYSKHRLTACQAIFPVCDVTYHFNERVDLPRTFYYAFNGYPEDLPTVLREHSPLHQAAQMPAIPYQILHGDADKAVNKGVHSDKMVAALRQHQRNVEYIEIPEMDHGPITSFAAYRRKIDFIKDFLTAPQR